MKTNKVLSWLILLFFAMLIIPSIASEHKGWGFRIPFDYRFKTGQDNVSDSVRLYSYEEDTLMSIAPADTFFFGGDTIIGDRNRDTLYSEGIITPPTLGSYTIVAYFQKVNSTAADSITLAVRYGWQLGERGGTGNIVWGPFNDLFGFMKAESLYYLEVVSDCTWHVAANLRQYRITMEDRSADTVLHGVTDYVDEAGR